MTAISNIRTSESIDAIAEAFAAAQGEFPAVEKKRMGKIEGESKNSGRAFSYTYAYADLADILAAALPTLSKHKLAILQPTVMDGNVLTIVTRIVHGGSGQWIESDYPVCSIQGDHKKMGAALTYSRRYAACSILGIAPEEDTDGDGAEEVAPPQRSAPRQDNRSQPAQSSHQHKLKELPSDQTPFDDVPYAKDFEPAVSTKAIAFGREMKGCSTIPDLNSFKKTAEFKAAYAAFNDTDRDYLIKLNGQIVADIEGNDMRMAG